MKNIMFQSNHECNSLSLTCHFSCTGNWELLKLIVEAKEEIMLVYIFKQEIDYSMTANGCDLLRYTMIISVQKLTQVIKPNTAGFQRIKRHNRKILKRILKRPLK